MIYLELLWSFVQIGLFSIGGGYAAMPLIQHQVVDLHPWLTMTQFADVIAIAEMSPGPIALNAATFVGIQVAGLPGALVATAGSVLPSCVIVLLLAFLYYKFKGFSVIQGILAGVRPAVVAMIASAGVSMVLLAVYGTRTLPADPTAIQWTAVAILAGGLVVLRKWKVNPVWVILGSSFGVVAYGGVRDSVWVEAPYQIGGCTPNHTHNKRREPGSLLFCATFFRGTCTFSCKYGPGARVG